MIFFRIWTAFSESVESSARGGALRRGGTPKDDHMFLRYEDIRQILIEPTNKCNLLCPQCARVDDGRVNPRLNLTELSVQDYENIFTSDLSPRLDVVTLNGNYGDPAAASNLLWLVEFLKKGGVNKIQINSNGSLRSKSWWKDLAKLLSGPRDEVVFGIDGLKDTNRRYRVNSIFEKIMENAEEYIRCGGRALWSYLVFEHNQHQVEEAQALARKIGFRAFHIRKSTRFVCTENSRKSRPWKAGRAAHDASEGKTTEKLQPPSGGEYRSAEIDRFAGIVSKYGSWFEYIKRTPIECKFQAEKSLFVDFDANVWPCCWVGCSVYLSKAESLQRRQIAQVMGNYARNFNNIREQGIQEILAHRWFEHDLEMSWRSSPDDANPKLMTCGRTCGQEYEFTSGRGKNRIEIAFD